MNDTIWINDDDIVVAMDIDTPREYCVDTVMTVVPSTSFLESRLEPHVMNTILSFLTLSDYNRICAMSKSLQKSVHNSSHLHGDTLGLFRFRRRRSNSTTVSSTETTIKSPDTQDSSPQDELTRLLHRFSFLKLVHLEGLAPVGDDLIRILNESPSAPTLTSLALHGCALSYWCPESLKLDNLQSLTLSGNSIRARVSSLLQNLTCLKSLSLKQCTAIRDEDVHDIGKAVGDTLQELTISHLKLNKPASTFPNLRKASFVGCFGLRDLSKFVSPNLVELNVSFCVRLSGAQIEQLVEQMPMLETLIMMKCNGVESLELESEHLRRLDARFTHNLKRLRLSCPAMERLETHCCTSLDEVVLDDAGQLPWLDLSGSLRLRQVQVYGAHNLTHLSLRGCRNLNDCHIDTPNLEHANVTGSRTFALRFCKHVRKAIIRSWSTS